MYYSRSRRPPVHLLSKLTRFSLTVPERLIGWRLARHPAGKGIPCKIEAPQQYAFHSPLGKLFVLVLLYTLGPDWAGKRKHLADFEYDDLTAGIGFLQLSKWKKRKMQYCLYKSKCHKINFQFLNVLMSPKPIRLFIFHHTRNLCLFHWDYLVHQHKIVNNCNMWLNQYLFFKFLNKKKTWWYVYIYPDTPSR